MIRPTTENSERTEITIIVVVIRVIRMVLLKYDSSFGTLFSFNLVSGCLAYKVIINILK